MRKIRNLVAKIRTNAQVMLGSLAIGAVLAGITVFGLKPELIFYDAPFDKILHFGAFFVLAIAVGAVTGKFRAAFLFSLAAGTGLEIAQMFVPGRTAAIDDVVANGIGALCAWLLMRWLENRQAAAREIYAQSTHISRNSY
ncbi:MAG: VanZ family protein [Cohaesibacteraceae bacterium]|nr:VanZ family protein [Cohaesibacteraceae bacterium]